MEPCRARRVCSEARLDPWRARVDCSGDEVGLTPGPPEPSCGRPEPSPSGAARCLQHFVRVPAVGRQPCLRLVMLVSRPSQGRHGCRHYAGAAQAPTAAGRESAVHCSLDSSLTTRQRRRRGLAAGGVGSRGAVSTLPLLTARKPCQHLIHGGHLPMLGPLGTSCAEPVAVQCMARKPCWQLNPKHACAMLSSQWGALLLRLHSASPATSDGSNSRAPTCACGERRSTCRTLPHHKLPPH